MTQPTCAVQNQARLINVTTANPRAAFSRVSLFIRVSLYENPIQRPEAATVNQIKIEVMAIMRRVKGLMVS